MKTMILAAGYGRRLLPLTQEIPKPLLLVGRKTLIQRNIEILLDSGFNDLVINTSYLGHMINNHVTKNFPLAIFNFLKRLSPLEPAVEF